MIRSRASRVAISLMLLMIGVATGCGATGEDRDARTADTTPSTTRPEREAPPQSGVTAGRLGDASSRRDEDGGPSVSEGGPFDVSPPRSERRREGVGAGDACPGTDAEASAANLPAIVAATTCLLNAERRDRGLVALTPNAALLKAATVHARDMVAHSFFSHTGRDRTQSGDRIKAAGYLRGAASWMVGENLAWGSGAMSTPKIIMRAWMNSPGHRENILEPDYRDVGLAVLAGNPASPDGSGATYVTEFGFRKVAPVSRPRRTRSSSAATRARAQGSSPRDR